MRVIGFNYTKISIEKLDKSPESVENLNIDTGIEISNINEVKQKILNTDEKLLDIDFEYNVRYKPEIALLDFKGKLILAADPKTTKEILKQWKDKKILPNVKIFLFNIIMKKSILKALNLEDELNLPLHLPLPSIKTTPEETKQK